MESAGEKWQNLSLDDYEGYMEASGQQEILDEAMSGQFAAYPGHKVVVLGAGPGTGFEHAYGHAFDKIYAVDINEEFLKACRERHEALGDALVPVHLDLETEFDELPGADMLLADLVIEHIGKWAFLRAVRAVRPAFVSCVFITSRDRESRPVDLGLPPDSPFSKVMTPIENDHQPIRSQELDAMLAWYGRAGTWQQNLSGDRRIMRIDYVPRRQSLGTLGLIR